MLILLPPSETKHRGGSDEPVRLETLAFPELNRTRSGLITAVGKLSARPKAAAAALGLGPRQLDELDANLELLTAPTMPAIERYTGVLYDAFDVATFRPAERRRASERVAIASALFGLVRAEDRIPAYRLSAGSKLPRRASMPSIWKPQVQPLLAGIAEHELIVDLRSGAYQSLGTASAAVTVRVLSERPDGSRGVVSHFNKSTKGQLARLLVQASTECQSVGDVAGVARRGGLSVELTGEHSMDVITVA